MSRDRIVAAALALVDEEGPEALSMRHLGAALGCDASALYRHFRDKQSLLDAVADRLISLADLSAPAADPWQDVRGIALAVRQAVLLHPRSVPLLAARPPLGPAAQRVVERLLASLTQAGLSPSEATQALQLLVTLTLGTLTNATRTDRTLSEARHREVTRALRAAPQEHPLGADLARFLRRNDDAEHFTFALDTVLSGLRQRVQPG